MTTLVDETMPSRQQIEALLQDDPNDIFLLYGLAKAIAAEGDIEAALAAFDDVIARDGDYVAAYFQKGQVLAEEGRNDEARPIVARGIEAARRTGDRHAELEMTGFLETL